VIVLKSSRVDVGGNVGRRNVSKARRVERS
jgi:hypothetical protein